MKINHTQCLELLPWYANGTLDETEMTNVSTHLTGCPACRGELNEIIAEMRSLNTHAPQIEQTIPALASSKQKLLSTTLSIAILLVAAAGAYLWPATSDSDADFTLLSDHPSEVNVVQIAFKPSTTEAEFRSLILNTGGELLGNPTIGGIYKIQYKQTPPIEDLRRATIVAWLNDQQ